MGADGLRWALRSSKSLVPVLPPGRWVRLPRAPATLPVPTSLLERADGTALREAWRQFLHASVMPVSLSVSAELSEKLDTDIRLSFDRMFASDLSGRARAFQVDGRRGNAGRQGSGPGRTDGPFRMMFAQACTRCVGGTYLALDGDRVCIMCGPTVGLPVHARPALSRSTWCGLPVAHVARAQDVDEVTCARCRAALERRYGRRKAAALSR